MRSVQLRASFEAVSRPLTGLLDCSVPDFDEASHGRSERRQVPAIDPSPRQPSRKRLMHNRPVFGGPGLIGNRDLNHADGRLLDLNGASDNSNVRRPFAIHPPCFPGAVPARCGAPRRNATAGRHLNGSTASAAFDCLSWPSAPRTRGLDCVGFSHVALGSSCQRIYVPRKWAHCVFKLEGKGGTLRAREGRRLVGRGDRGRGDGEDG